MRRKRRVRRSIIPALTCGFIAACNATDPPSVESATSDPHCSILPAYPQPGTLSVAMFLDASTNSCSARLSRCGEPIADMAVDRAASHGQVTVNPASNGIVVTYRSLPSAVGLDEFSIRSPTSLKQISFIAWQHGTASPVVVTNADRGQSADLLRRALDTLRADPVDLTLFTPSLATVVVAHRDNDVATLRRFGSIMHVEYIGLANGYTVYEVRFDHQVRLVKFRLRDDGKVAALSF